MAKNLQNNEQVLGTVSIISLAKKPNKQDMMIKYTWEYSFKPDNQQQMDPLKLDKLRKHHSSQDSQHHRLPNNNVFDSQLIQDRVQNQYHSLLYDKTSSNNNKYTNQYGLVKRKNNGKDQHEYEPTYNLKEKDNILTQQEINQYQRVLGMQNDQSKYQKNTISNNQLPNTNKATFNTFPNNQNTVKIAPKINKNLNKTPLDNTSQVQTFVFTPTNDNNNNNHLLQTYRDEDILHHRKLSNYNYMAAQTKELLQLCRMYLVLIDIEECRKIIMKTQIQCRRLKISLRTGNSGSKLTNQKNQRRNVQISHNHHLTAMQEYGYTAQAIKQNSQDKLRIPTLNKISSTRNLMKRSGSNLLNLDSTSNLKQYKQQQTYLQSNITKLKQRLQSLKNKQQQIDQKLNQAITRSQKNPTKILNPTRPSPTKNIQQLQTQQTIIKKSEQKQYHNNSFNSIKNKSKQSQYRTLLIEKRNVIKQCIQEFSQHVKYKIEKLNEENTIMKEQVKIVEKRIFDLGRLRNKNSVSSHSNSNNKLVRQHISLPRKLLTMIHNKKQHSTTNNIQQNKQGYKIKKSVLLRSPDHHQYLASGGKNYHLKLSPKKKLLMKRACSEEVLIPSIQRIHQEEQEQLFYGGGHRNQYLNNIQSYNYIQEKQFSREI